LSGIVGIVAPAGDAIDRRLVERMVAAQRRRGPDRHGVWIDRSVALAHGQLAVTPEGVDEAQPWANEAGTVRVVLDGRFDNRADLVRALDAAGHGPRNGTDAELLLRAYEAWGPACAARLLGDFAFAIWDDVRRALVCARDVLGARPLYVHAGGRVIAVASEIAPLLEHPDVGRAPNDGFVAECLTGKIVHRTDTVWRDVTRLQPAHVLTATDGRVSVQRYWEPDPRLEIRYRRDEEYGEHLAALVRTAVRPRLRSIGPVGVMLSGGVDSSSIVGAMHQMDAVSARGLPAYSMAAPGEEWDETPFIDAVADRYPVASRRTGSFHADRAHLAAASVSVQDLPPYPNGEMANDLFAAASADGVRVLLTGSWSDWWFTGSYQYYADLARTLQFGALWRHLRAPRDPRDAFRPRSMFRSMIWPLVPLPVRHVVKQSLGRDGVSPWVAPAFARSAGLADRLRPRTPEIAFRTLSMTETYGSAFGGGTIHGVEAHERSVAHFGLDTRHPFGDRRILEFGLALPEEQRWRGALTKFVLRTAARDWLPPAIRERTTCGTASGVVCRTVRDLVASGLWQNSVIARRSWVDPHALTRAFNEMMTRYDADGRYHDLANRLWLVCAVELWARHVLEERPVV
jgi:asparagine synthase (glutamine-hydrolysing)